MNARWVFEEAENGVAGGCDGGVDGGNGVSFLFLLLSSSSLSSSLLVLLFVLLVVVIDESVVVIVWAALLIVVPPANGRLLCSALQILLVSRADKSISTPTRLHYESNAVSASGLLVLPDRWMVMRAGRCRSGCGGRRRCTKTTRSLPRCGDSWCTPFSASPFSLSITMLPLCCVGVLDSRTDKAPS